VSWDEVVKAIEAAGLQKSVIIADADVLAAAEIDFLLEKLSNTPARANRCVRDIDLCPLFIVPSPSAHNGAYEGRPTTVERLSPAGSWPGCAESEYS
jgi:hypothetical protein